MLPDNVAKIPCSAHRIILCVNDLFKVVKISEKECCFFIYDYNEFDELRKIEINIETKLKIEESNTIKEGLNTLISKCKRLVSSFSHSESLVRQLKQKQKFPHVH